MTKFTFATSEEGFDNHIDKSVRGIVTYGVIYLISIKIFC